MEIRGKKPTLGINSAATNPRGREAARETQNGTREVGLDPRLTNGVGKRDGKGVGVVLLKEIGTRPPHPLTLRVTPRVTPKENPRGKGKANKKDRNSHGERTETIPSESC